MTGLIGLVATAVLVTGVDQLTKRQVAARMVEGELRPVVGFARVHRITNRRGGLVALPTAVAGVLLAAMAAAALVVAAAPDSESWLVVALGLAVGGAVSNIADRLGRGGVLDFISVGRWPTFNLADVALVAGVVLAVGGLVLGVG